MVDRDTVVALLNRRRFPWTVLRQLALVSVLSLGLLAAAAAWREARDPSECVGSWPNCPPSPIEAVLLLGFFVYGPALAGLAAVLGVAQLFGPRLHLLRSVVALLVAATMVVATLVFAVEAVA